MDIKHRLEHIVDLRDSTKLFSKESVIIEDFNGWMNNGMNETN